MNDPTPARLSGLLAGPRSPFRAELAALIVDAALDQKVSALIDRDALRDEIVRGLAKAHGDAVAHRHVLPAIERIAAALEGRAEQLRDLLSPAAAAQLSALVRREEGPRFAWLQGAIDPDDVRQLVAPITQQLLMQFASKLPIPGLGGGGALGGLVGKLGKQVQRSAGQLADVGRSMLAGVVRDFSQTATSEFRVAFEARVKSPEGKQIIARMRDRWLAHVLAAKADEVLGDLMKLPRAEIAGVVTEVLAHAPAQPLLRALIEQELDAQLAILADSTVGALIGERGALEQTRGRLREAVDARLALLVQSAPFEAWLTRLIAAAKEEKA